MSYTPSEQRYETMQYRRAGNSGLLLPELSLGLWHGFGNDADPENMKAMLKTAFDLGITHFDLANNYGPPYGAAEEQFGKLFSELFRPYRDELLISTKAGYDMWPGPYGNWGSRKYLIASIDQSLMRMGLSYVDIFYHHRMDPHTPLQETMEALDQIVRSGKALYIGLSNYNGEVMTQAKKLLDKLHTPYIINQNRYSLFDRTIERNGLKEASKAQRKGIIAFSPLAQGLLTGKYADGIPSDSRIVTDGRYLKEDDVTEQKNRRVLSLQKIAKERGQTLTEMALSWVLKDEEVCSVLMGASRPEQIRENVKILKKTPFSEEELKAIDAIGEP